LANVIDQSRCAAWPAWLALSALVGLVHTLSPG